MRTLVVSTVPMGLAFGTLEVAMPALATRHGHPAAAGILMGAFAGGSLIGGLWYGSRTWRGSLPRRYVFLTAVFAAGMAPLVLAGAIPVMVLLIAVAGLTLAPVAACELALIEDVAPPGTTTEAFSWIFTANMVGASAGAAAAGAVIHSSGIRAALLIPVCGVAASFLLALARRRTLTPLPAALASRGAAVASRPAAGASRAAADMAAPASVPRPGTRVLTAAALVPGVTVGAGGLPVRSHGVPARTVRPSFLAAGLVVVAALLGYGRSHSYRRSRRR
jgi:MFS family permease